MAQSCLTLCDPMDCSPPGSPVHGIFQARILERVAIPFSRGSSQPRDQTQVSCIAGSLCIMWATGKAQFTPKLFMKSLQLKRGKMFKLIMFAWVSVALQLPEHLVLFISLYFSHSKRWYLYYGFNSPVAQTVKNLPTMQETWVWSLGQEDPLEERMATHSSILAWEIPWTEKPGGLQSMGSQKSWTWLRN